LLPSAPVLEVGDTRLVTQIWHSRRWRRRLVWSTILALAIPIAFVAIHYSDAGDPGNASGPEVPDYVQPTNSPFTAAEKQQVRHSLKEFISGAVAGENPAQGWNVSAASLKQGTTRKEWESGQMPVVPYPAAERGLGSWSFVQYSYTNLVGLEVFVFPKPGSGYSAMTADVELVKRRDGRWLVAYWMPKRFHGPPALSATQLKQVQKDKRARAKPVRREAAAEEEPYQPPQQSHAWLAVPIALLSLVFIVPLAIVLIYWIQSRRATRAFAGSSRT
jgi:hypothetical protein